MLIYFARISFFVGNMNMFLLVVSKLTKLLPEPSDLRKRSTL